MEEQNQENTQAPEHPAETPTPAAPVEGGTDQAASTPAQPAEEVPAEGSPATPADEQNVE